MAISKPVYRIDNVYPCEKGVVVERQPTLSKDFVDGLAYSEDIENQPDWLKNNCIAGDVLHLENGIYVVSKKPNGQLTLDKFSLS